MDQRYEEYFNQKSQCVFLSLMFVVWNTAGEWGDCLQGLMATVEEQETRSCPSYLYSPNSQFEETLIQAEKAPEGTKSGRTRRDVW